MTSPHDHHPRHRPWKRLALAVVVVILAIAAAGAVPVKTGEAAVITRFGAPVRVVTEPGLTWILPPPIERAQLVDRRLRTTATGSHGVLTKDGLSLVVQAYAAWRVGGDGATVLRYVRATGSDGDMAANQLRTLLNSSLETVSGRFVLADLVNTDPTPIAAGAIPAAAAIPAATTAQVPTLRLAPSQPPGLPTDPDGDPISPELAAILVHLRTNGQTTASDLCAALKLTDRTASRRLAQLRDRGLARFVGTSRRGHWEAVQ